MMKKLFILTFLAVMLNFPTAASAQTQPQCNKRDSVMSQLKENHNEVPVSMGVTHNGALIEIFASPNGETWSIVITDPFGRSCLVSAGSGWKMLTDIEPDPASLGQGI